MLHRDSTAKWIVFAALFVVLFAAVHLVLSFKDKAKVQIGGKLVTARVVDTDAERAKGLSGSSELQDGEAMLFVFDHADKWKIWMKDMNYSIDIVWLDEQKKIIHIVQDASPDSYPQTFEPRDPARYVIELPAGYTSEHNITRGSVVSFQGYP